MATPPAPPPLAPPNGDPGKAAAAWLAAHGLIPQFPTIRSSDYDIALTDPFRYYLTRRLGLAPLLSWSAALSRGTWTHEAFRLDPFGDGAPDVEAYAQVLTDRIDELRVIAGHLGITGDGLDKILDRERKDADTSWGWYMAARTVDPAPPNYYSIQRTFGTGQVLARELRVVIPVSKIASPLMQRGAPTPRTSLVAQFDALWLVKDSAGRPGVWIVDLKTTSDSPRVRLSTCPIEFQAQHYAHVFAWAQDHDPSQLPEGARDADLLGVLHIAIQKPSIQFCDMDRDCTESTHTITRGPRKGQVEVRREYHGEPSIANYITRCQEWYLGTGRYQDQAKAREADPTVNYSFVGARSLFGRFASEEYYQKLGLILHYCSLEALPRNFLRSDHGARDLTGLSFWAPFYLTPPDDWPGIVNKLGLVTKFRDEDLMELA